MTKFHFIIVSCRLTRGGTLVLSALCKLLRDRGYSAKMFYINDLPKKETNWTSWWLWQIRSYIKMPFIRLLCALNKSSEKEINKIRREIIYQPIKGLPTQYFPIFNRSKTIVVYPEIIYGNFLKAKKVVRYLLYYNKLYKADDKDSFGENDLFIAHREVFNDPDLNPGKNLVQLNWFDSTLYRQYNFGERKGNCYILRKGKNRPDCPDHFDGPVIDYGMSEEQIVQVFNQCKYCYSYDMQTYYLTIAAVCGCIPILIPEPGKVLSDYFGHQPKPLGRAWGDSPEEIQFALNTRAALLKKIDYQERNEKNISHFLQLVESYFSNPS